MVLVPILPSTINGCDSSGCSAERPKNPDAGQPYFDTDELALMLFDGEKWVKANCDGKCSLCENACNADTGEVDTELESQPVSESVPDSEPVNESPAAPPEESTSEVAEEITPEVPAVEEVAAEEPAPAPAPPQEQPVESSTETSGIPELPTTESPAE